MSKIYQWFERRRINKLLDTIENEKNLFIDNDEIAVPYLDENDELIDYNGTFNANIIKESSYFKILHSSIWFSASVSAKIATLQWFENKIAEEYNTTPKKISPAYFEGAETMTQSEEFPDTYFINVLSIIGKEPGYFHFLDFLNESALDKNKKKVLSKIQKSQKLKPKDVLEITDNYLRPIVIDKLFTDEDLRLREKKEVVLFFYNPIQVKIDKFSDEVIDLVEFAENIIGHKDIFLDTYKYNRKHFKKKISKIYQECYGDIPVEEMYEIVVRKLKKRIPRIDNNEYYL